MIVPSSQTLGLATTWPQGIAWCSVRRPRLPACRCAPVPGGRRRDARPARRGTSDRRRPPRRRPANPKIENVHRQPTRLMKKAASGGVIAPPSCEVVVIAPRAKPRSPGGNQRVTTRAALGNAPASPAPNRNRDRHQRPQAERRPGQSREGRPPEDDPRDHAPRAKAVAPVPGRHLETGSRRG